MASSRRTNEPSPLEVEGSTAGASGDGDLEDFIRGFRIDQDHDLELDCPDCFESIWLTSTEAPTLGDAIDILATHKCFEEEEDEE